MDDTGMLKRVDDLRSRGNDFFRTERYDEAIGVYTEALDLLDDLECHGDYRVTLLNNRSLARYRKGNAYKDSMQDATSVLDMDEKNEKALYRRACCALMLDEPHQAAVDFEHLVTIRRTRLEGNQNAEGAQKEYSDNVLSLLAYARQVATYTLLTSDESNLGSDTDDAVVQIETILEALWADAEGVDSDGNGDVNLNSELARLQTLLGTSVRARAVFRAKGGLRLMWFHFTPAHATLVADALRAACKEGMEWSVVSRLITLVFEEKDCIDVASTALDLLTWAAASWVWVKDHLLLERPPSSSLNNGRSSTIWAVASRLASHHPPWHDLRMISSAVNLLTLYSTGSVSPSLDVSSVVNALLDAYHATEDSDSEETSAQKAAGVSDEEEAARLALLEKRRKVYDARVVAVRRQILIGLVQFCTQKSVLLQSTGLQRKKPGHQHLIVHSLVQKLVSDVLADLIAKAPKKTTPILGPDGIPAAYTKRPFVADWTDNPAGDFLTTLDLDEKNDEKNEASSKPGDKNKHAQNATLPSATVPTLIELTVTALIKACETTVTACQVAHRSKVLDACEELFKFATPSIVVQAQTLYAVVCRTVPTAMEMVLESGTISALSGIARYCENYRAVALNKLAVHVDACCGDDFYRLTDDPDLSLIPFLIAHLSTMCDGTDSKVRYSCIQLLRLCLDRKGRHNSAYSNIKGPWKGLEDIPEFAKARKQRRHDEGFQHVFKAGFLNAGIRPASATNTQNRDVETQLVMEKCSNGHNVETSTFVENEGDMARESDPDQLIESLPDLKDVYDSTPKDFALRQARSKWLARPAEERHRWAQTSSDVSIWVSVPGGTRAKEVTVTVSGQHITVLLSWYGKVLDGDLHAGVKSQEMTWCIEASSGDEVHIVLPKDGAGRWWKSLLVGGEEKGYYEILKEAVHADEPTVPYDSMDPEAKELLDSLLERQAYVNAGLIDLENGFDDFRVVIGESSLGGPTS